MFNNKMRSPLDFSGFFEGTVVTNDDPKKQGRVGVAIKRLMPFAGSYTKIVENRETVVKNNNKDSNDNISGTSQGLKATNFIWCNRASNRFEYHDEEANKRAETGSFIVPPVGAVVFVIFLNEDIRYPYYLPFGPAVEGSSTLKNSTIEGDTGVDLMHETINGDTIGFENDNQQFFLQMSDKSGVLVDAKEKKIVINTAEDAAVISLDNDKIQIIANEVNVQASKVNVTADETYLDSKVISLKSNDSQKWAPNIITNCPLGGFVHGGIPAGIKDLKGF